MPRPRLYKTEAIVLKHSAIGEADYICTVYTPTYGKLKVVARGARRPLSHKSGHLEPLTRASLLLAQGSSMDVVSECTTIEAFLPLRDDLWRTTCGMYLAELTDQFTVERAENYPLYRLLLGSLEQLSRGKDGGLLLRYFEVNLLRHLGFRPELDRCAECGATPATGPYIFSASAGGLVCAQCKTRQHAVRSVSTEGVRALRVLLRGDYQAALKLELWDDLAVELEMLLRQHLWYLLERELKSPGILDQLRRRVSSLG